MGEKPDEDVAVKYGDQGKSFEPKTNEYRGLTHFPFLPNSFSPAKPHQSITLLLFSLMFMHLSGKMDT